MVTERFKMTINEDLHNQALNLILTLTITLSLKSTHYTWVAVSKFFLIFIRHYSQQNTTQIKKEEGTERQMYTVVAHIKL